jgi:hypothetical protein
VHLDGRDGAPAAVLVDGASRPCPRMDVKPSAAACPLGHGGCCSPARPCGRAGSCSSARPHGRGGSCSSARPRGRGGGGSLARPLVVAATPPIDCNGYCLAREDGERRKNGLRLKDKLTCGAHTLASGGREAVGVFWTIRDYIGL